MTVDPRRPVDELRAMADRMRELEDRIERLAAPSGTQVFRAVQNLTDRAVRASGAAALVSVAVPTGGSSVITWGALALPALTLTTPYSSVIISVGAIATAIGLSTSDFVLAHLGLSINGATPSITVGDWPSVSSQNPFSGSDQTASLQLSRLVAVTPGVPITVSPRYGHNRYGAVNGTAAVEFSSRFITVTPVP